jgi:hypothetical protein
MNVRIIFLALAFVLFVLSGLNVGHPRVSLGWLGLAFLTLALWFPEVSAPIR